MFENMRAVVVVAAALVFAAASGAGCGSSSNGSNPDATASADSAARDGNTGRDGTTARDGNAGRDGNTARDGNAARDGTTARDGNAAADGSTAHDSANARDSASTRDASSASDSATASDSAVSTDSTVDTAPAHDTVCVPQCSGKPCGGANGCGGVCSGYCGANESCIAFQCSCTYVTCGTTCCNAGELCKQNQCVAGPTPSWKVVSSGTQQNLYAAWASSAKDVWVAGGSGTVLHCDGVKWRSLITGTLAALRAVWGSGPKDVYFGGDDNNATVSTGILLHYDGSSIKKVNSFTVAQHPQAIWGISGSDFRVGGGWVPGWVRHYKGGAWSSESLPASGGTLGAIFALHGSGPTDIWGVRSRQAVHYDGQKWTAFALPSGDQLRGVWASAPNDVWVVGGYAHVIYRYDGVSFKPVTSPINHGSSSTANGYHAIWGSAPNDVWAVGSKGGIAHFDGSGWSISGAGVTTNWLYGVWGSSAVDVWAVGSSGMLLHFTP